MTELDKARSALAAYVDLSPEYPLICLGKLTYWPTRVSGTQLQIITPERRVIPCGVLWTGTQPGELL